MRFFGRSIRLQGATAGYFITSGRISAKNLEAAPKMLPPVYALDGQRLWKAVQAQRGKKSTGLPKPS
jgi:restriction endonuclease Mrr